MLSAQGAVHGLGQAGADLGAHIGEGQRGHDRGHQQEHAGVFQGRGAAVGVMDPSQHKPLPHSIRAPLAGETQKVNGSNQTRAKGRSRGGRNRTPPNHSRQPTTTPDKPPAQLKKPCPHWQVSPRKSTEDVEVLGPLQNEVLPGKSADEGEQAESKS
ncbi:hypothetical protein Nans01_48750 [Nocardiopsis ansamitocini]|uniref:Uncharacterized protein n=1 Tax=Nocardiopsis ansamitocini TaxID=1670832 RepID=A0A9W6UL00_9ACTN|nr:hypothetical protein Nans01_48750 [Nocardiopsis ansamitocini]